MLHQHLQSFRLEIQHRAAGRIEKLAVLPAIVSEEMSASGGMSSLRSRSGGSAMLITFSR